MESILLIGNGLTIIIALRYLLRMEERLQLLEDLCHYPRAFPMEKGKKERGDGVNIHCAQLLCAFRGTAFLNDYC